MKLTKKNIYLKQVFYTMSLLSMLSVVTLSNTAQATETWNSSDLDNFIDGATIMAAGGGGSPKIARKLLDKYFTTSDMVQLNNIGDIIKGQGHSAAAVGAIGSPAELFHLTDPLGLPLNAYAALDLTFAHLENPINYLMPIEVGAINGLYPFLLASKLNNENENSSAVISVLNVDGGGRSVPTLPLLIYSYFPNTYNQQAAVTSPSASIVPPFPYPSEWALLQAPSGNQGRIEATILSMLSGADSPYKGAAGYGSFYADADKIPSSPPVIGQLLVAHDAGKAYKSSPTGSSVAGSLNSSGRKAKVIFSGTVTNVILDTKGLDYGVVTISGSGVNAGDTFSIQYENENICAYKKSYSTTAPFVLGPDSVTYVPTNGTIFDNSDLYNMFKAGVRPAVDIVAIQASPQITQIPEIMTAWEAVRAAIPEKKCNFPYVSPWLDDSTVLGQVNGKKYTFVSNNVTGASELYIRKGMAIDKFGLSALQSAGGNGGSLRTITTNGLSQVVAYYGDFRWGGRPICRLKFEYDHGDVIDLGSVANCSNIQTKTLNLENDSRISGVNVWSDGWLVNGIEFILDRNDIELIIER